jgi:hypothetical protein
MTDESKEKPKQSEKPKTKEEKERESWQRAFDAVDKRRSPKPSE